MRWVPSPGFRAPGELGVWEVDWEGTGPGVFRLGQTLRWTDTWKSGKEAGDICMRPLNHFWIKCSGV